MSGRVLVGCEFSGTVREEFLSRGYDAWSCDLLPDERGSNRHIRGDVLDVIEGGDWDLCGPMSLFPIDGEEAIAGAAAFANQVIARHAKEPMLI